MKKILVIWGLLLCVFSAAVFALPVESFGQLPDVSNVSLSPDGNTIASMIRIDLPNQKGSAVQVINTKTKASKILLFSDNSEYVIFALHWKDNKTLLVHGFASLEQKTWGQGQRSKEKIRATRLLFVDSETGNVTKPFTSMFLSQFKVAPASLDEIADTLPEDPDHILMTVLGTVYKVNIQKGTANIYGEQPKTFMANVTDLEHRLRAGYEYDNDGEVVVKFYDLDKKTWVSLARYKGAFSADEVNIIGFPENPDELYISAYHNDRKSIFKIDLKDPQFKRELVLTNPNYDIDGYLVYSRDRKQVIGISGGEDEGTFFINDDLSTLQNSINKAMPATKNHIYSFSDE